MPNTFTLISTTTLTGSQASIDLTSIPQTYTDLQVVLSTRAATSSSGNDLVMRFNNQDTTYSRRFLNGNGSGTSSSTANTSTGIGVAFDTDASYTANTFTSTAIYIPNYSGSTAKSISVDSVQENNATSSQQFIIAGLFTGTSAITSIKFNYLAGSANFVVGSSVSLYGITKGSGGATVS